MERKNEHRSPSLPEAQNSSSVCVYMYIYLYVCMYVCMYVCVFVCVLVREGGGGL